MLKYLQTCIRLLYLWIVFQPDMKNLFLFVVIFISCTSLRAAVLWSQDFSVGTSGFYSGPTGFTRSLGNTYACASGNYVLYTNTSNAYMVTNTISVPQGKGIKLSFDSRRKNSTAGIIKVFYLITGACSFSTTNTSNNGWVEWGTITPNTSVLSPGGCTNQNLQLESDICGGQNISVAILMPNGSSTNWITIDNILIEDNGPTSYPIPIISGATTYTENFTNSKWYGPVTTGNYSTTGTRIPYHSYKSSSDAYTYLFNNGCNGTANHAGVFSDYYAAFYTGFESCNASGASQIITKELNTSTCANPMIKYAYKAKYPCTAGNYDNTFDEDYQLYAPKLYTSTGQGYTWTQQAVNYYFPDGLWHFAAYAVPSAANIKVRLTRGGSCSSPVEGVDHLKVFCEDCRISALSGGTITGESNPANNTDYTYTITPTSYATYYKWMIRAIDRTPPVVIEAACPNGTDPCIVSGQGTTSVVINFGSNASSENFRVMCIPYDANPGTLAAPSDACYAEISLFPTTTLPVEWGYFRLNGLENEVIVEWQTLTETNNDHFEVQKSSDGEHFNTLTIVAGAGNSNVPVEYDYSDPIQDAGTFYYRIRQVDYDGKESFSRVLSIISENPSAGITISSLISNELTVNTVLPVLYPLQLSMFDMQGRLVYAPEAFTLGAAESRSWNVETLPDGLYFIKITGNGVNLSSSLLKARGY